MEKKEIKLNIEKTKIVITAADKTFMGNSQEDGLRDAMKEELVPAKVFRFDKC